MGNSSSSTEEELLTSPGDNILAEFGSVVDAVQCSVAVQNEFKARNSEVPESRRMVFRIGSILGMYRGGRPDLWGWCEHRCPFRALAEPGGICIPRQLLIISKANYRSVSVSCEQTVKNIAKPVEPTRFLWSLSTPAEEIKKAREVPFWRRKPVLLVWLQR